ncbi:hypothetical protein [Algibacter mikhailovii]|uniref:hypothetical protein n=1 Tax=Algibacter mikhailovii TaxID=425498 RepID=UPI0024959E5B|nr:hypothetical protein [Algibacter mikhailovii]
MTNKNKVISIIVICYTLIFINYVFVFKGEYNSETIFKIVFLVCAASITILSIYLLFIKKENNQIPKPSLNKEAPVVIPDKKKVFNSVKKIKSTGIKKVFGRPTSIYQSNKSKIDERKKRQEQAKIIYEEKELQRLIALEEITKKRAQQSKIKRVVKPIRSIKDNGVEPATKKTIACVEKKAVPKKTPALKKTIVKTKIKKRVNFSTLNIKTSTTKYPIIRKPNQNSIIRTFRFERNNRKGFKEEEFYGAIKRHFSKNFEVIDNAMLAIGTGTNPYEPDIAMVSKSDKNIYIDIEIDEPYAGVTRKLTHCYPEDVNRDNYFVDRGWFVIRFSEYQIHHQIKECLFQIAKVVSVIDANYKVGRLSAYKSLIKEPNWDTSKARFWESINYRESYLNHIFKPYKEPENIIDTALTAEEKAEERLVKPQAYIPIANKTKPKATVEKKIEVKPIRRPFVAPVKKVLDSNNSSVAKLIEMAVNKNYVIEMTYTNRSEETSTRKISQLKYTKEFMNKGYAYKDHFAGFCHNRLEDRSFKISRIEYMKILN